MVYPRTVTHPNTNRVRHRATTLIETNTLPLSQTATTVYEGRFVSRGQQCLQSWNWQLIGWASSTAMVCCHSLLARYGTRLLCLMWTVISPNCSAISCVEGPTSPVTLKIWTGPIRSEATLCRNARSRGELTWRERAAFVNEPCRQRSFWRMDSSLDRMW